VAELKAGDEQAWDRFIADYGGTILAVASRFNLSHDDREDLFQNTCLSAVRSIQTLRNPARLSSWVYSIAYRLVVDMLRRRRGTSLERHGGGNPPIASAAQGASVEDSLVWAQEIARLHEALGRLEDRCRRLLRALYLCDQPLSYLEIARREGIPVGSIGPTRARCLKKMRILLDDIK
jgi:RNA polymerase sigma factor (sigma-70 family)